MVDQHPQLNITKNIFKDLARSQKFFDRQIKMYYTYFCRSGSYEPLLIDARLQDAYVAFRRDKKHMSNSLPDKKSPPDHFKMVGVLVYWLRRFAPVCDLRDLGTTSNMPKELVELLKEYPSELLAFVLGMSICYGFESEKIDNPNGAPAINANNYDFYKMICYMMKFKNISPHSLGVVYKALYIPIMPPKQLKWYK